MDWFAYSILGAICVTLFSLFERKFLKGKRDAHVFACLINVIAAVTLMTFFVIDTPLYSHSIFALSLLLISGILYATITILYTKARQLEEASNVAIVKQAESVWALAAGFFLLSEGLHFEKLIGISLLILGSVIVMWKGHTLKLTRGLLFILIGAFFAGLSGVIDKTLLEKSFSPALYGSLAFLLSAFFIFLTLPDKLKTIKTEIKQQNEHILTVGVLLGSGLFFVLKAFQVGEVSRVLPILNVSLVFTVVAGILFLNEKDNVWQKLIGAAIAFAGLFFLR